MHINYLVVHHLTTNVAHGTLSKRWISDIKWATMMGPRALRIVALLLALIAGAVSALGYNFIFDKNIRPQVNTLDDSN